MQNKKTVVSVITKIFAVITFLSVFLLNIFVFVTSGNSANESQYENLLSEASANTNVLDEPILAWSQLLTCPGSMEGTYNVCQINGPGNSCLVAGATTCECGVNCN